MEPLHPVLDGLWAARIPIPYPMKYVTVLVDTTGPVTLVDCALDTPEARAAMEAVLRELGLSWSDVQRVIVTHHHPDHYGLAGWIQANSGAAVVMLDVDIARGERHWSSHEQWLGGHVAHFLRHGLPVDDAYPLIEDSRRTRARVHPAKELTAVSEGREVHLAGRPFRVLWLPGHADGHLGLWSEEESLLIAGDAILERITPNIGFYSASRPDPLADYLDTLERIASLGADRAVVGHFGPIITGVAERAAQIARHHDDRLDQCLSIVDRPVTAWEVSLGLFTAELPPSGRRFALAETLAHLEHLRLQGRMGQAETLGIVRYQPEGMG
jgi:glyoxylase-like metal-dependent hydrolase (beta-lactamase superfamily II)